jgi:hypothetical protein
MAKMIGMRIPDVIWVKLQEAADANSVLPSEFARNILRDYFLASPSKSVCTIKQTAVLAQTPPPGEDKPSVPTYPAELKGNQGVVHVSKTKYIEGIRDGKFRCPKCGLWHLRNERGCQIN